MGSKEDLEGWRRVGGNRKQGRMFARKEVSYSIKVDSKWFGISLAFDGSRYQGTIEEQSKGRYSWIRLGQKGWEILLEGLELGGSKEAAEEWVWSWEEGRRRYSLELSENEGGRFIRLEVRDEERKFYRIFIPKGGKRGEGWAAVAAKLRLAGVGKMKQEGVGSKGRAEAEEVGCLQNSKRGEQGRTEEDKLWMMEVGSQKVARRLGQLKNCLIAQCVLEDLGRETMSGLRRRLSRRWRLRGKLWVAPFGKGMWLLEFENRTEAVKVMDKNLVWETEMGLTLVWWSPSFGCTEEGKSPREVWVRIVGLPLHF